MTASTPSSPSDQTRAFADFAFGSQTHVADASRPLAWLSPEELNIDLSDPVQRRFGDYELIERIGQGGMGVVYRARQHGLERDVAIKLLAAGPWASEEFVARFRREARSAARMQHPNIVEIYEFGHREGLNYFSMRLIEGLSLAQRLAKNGPMPAKDAAKLLRTLAEAMDYAHRLGVLHLDLKPANVLIGQNGEPLIADFGLARRIDAGHEGGSEEISGTPSYMAPEQALLESHPLTASTDIYGLGAILYELLTGRPPFTAANARATLECVLTEPPTPPRALRKDVPADLEAICLKCLGKDPAQRYDSARELADDLGRFLDGHSVLVRPLLLHQRLARWVRREPRLALLSIGLASAVSLLLAVSLLAIHSLVELNRDVFGSMMQSSRGRAFLTQITGFEPTIWRGPEKGETFADWIRFQAAKNERENGRSETAETLALSTLDDRALRERLYQRLISREMPGSAGSALLVQMGFGKNPSDKEFELTLRKTLDDASDEDALLIAATACESSGSPNCPTAEMIDLVFKRQPENAAVWVALASLPGVSDAQQKRLIVEASGKSRWRDVSELVYERLQPAYLDPTLSVGKEMSDLEGLASDGALRNFVAYGSEFNTRRAAMGALKQCGAVTTTTDSELRGACQRLADLLSDSRSMVANLRGNGLRFQLDHTSAIAPSLREWRQEYFWAQQVGVDLLVALQHDGPRQFFADFKKYGEYEAMRRSMDRDFIPRRPTEAWIAANREMVMFSAEKSDKPESSP